MDRDNTIARLENIAKHAVHTAGEDIFILNLDDGIAIHEAIEALKAQLSHESTTSDLISRQAAIDAAKDWYEGLICGSVNGLIKRLNALPSAQPEPHEGYWIPHKGIDGDIQYECSECGVLWEFNDGTPEDNEAYFCPNCGARMKGASE